MADGKAAGKSGSVFDVDTRSLLTRYSDIMLAAGVILIIGMMLIPLPHFLLDILLTANISLGVIILITSLYIAEPVKLASFPTILLLATMFRLALEIAVTRLVLGEADAGAVVAAFGQFVAGGNLVVGAVVFLIITIVQFLVIAKGAERISEVAARFTLDAMPGKQMSIDADLRAGAFDLDTARIKRKALERESQFYGSMDGAMKFVKGDAIAGLIIVAVNIIGGLSIGILQGGMSAGEAAEIYTILTIGSGLVSQISALLISTSAGLVTTRVAAEEGTTQTNLGKEIGSQLLEQPKAILIAGGFLGLLAIIPGLPGVPFFILAASVSFVGYTLHRKKQKMQAAGGAGAAAALEGEGAAEGEGGGAAANENEIILTPHPTPVILDVATELTPFVNPEAEGKAFVEQVPVIRKELYDDLGIRFPGIRIRSDVGACGPNGYIIRIYEVPLIRGTIPAGMCYVEESAQKLSFLGIEVKAANDPATGREACWVPTSVKASVEQMGVRVHDIAGFLLHEVKATLKRHAADFLGIQEVQAVLDEVGRSHPALVKEVIPKLVSTIHLTEILQRLVQEDVSIRDMRAILQSLARWAQVEKDTATLTEYVRSDLKQYISFKFSRGTREMSVYLLDPAIEGAIRSAIQRTPQGSYLALDPDTARRILATARKSLGNLPATASQPVVLTAVDVRRYLKKLLELDLPFVTVLSYQEISPLLTIQPVGRITLPVARQAEPVAH